MTETMTRVRDAVDRKAIEREADELRAQLKNYEDLLSLLDRIDTQSSPSDEPVVTNGNGHGTNVHALERVSLSEKRVVILEILRDRPGRWTNQSVRDALTERGIDPDGGTPVKNVMWNLAKAGEIHGSGGGVYDFPAPKAGATPQQEVLAA
jgi:hypothetical protein